MLIIGIDPGISGAICFFEDGEIKDIIDMPVMADGKKNKRQINGSQTYNEIYLRTKNFNIGFVPQHGGFFHDLTLFENLNAIAEIIIKTQRER